MAEPGDPIVDDDRYFSKVVTDLQSRHEQGQTLAVSMTAPSVYQEWCDRHDMDPYDPSDLDIFSHACFSTAVLWRNNPDDLRDIWQTELAVCAAHHDVTAETAVAAQNAARSLCTRLLNLVDDAAVVAAETRHPTTGETLTGVVRLSRTRRVPQPEHSALWRHVSGLITLAAYQSGVVTIRSVQKQTRGGSPTVLQHWFTSQGTTTEFESNHSTQSSAPDELSGPELSRTEGRTHPQLVRLVNQAWASGIQ